MFIDVHVHFGASRRHREWTERKTKGGVYDDTIAKRTGGELWTRGANTRE